MKETYSYIDILLALREEYKKQNEKLNRLKELTNTGAKSVVDFHYWVHRTIPEANPELMCRVETKNRFTSNYTQDFLLLKDNNDSFNFQDDSLYLKKNNIEEFNYIANKLLNDDVAKNMLSDVIKGSNTASNYAMLIKPYEIRTIITNGIVNGTYINYCSFLDKLSLSNYPEELNKELLIYLLSLDFKYKKMPKYIQELLVKNDKTNTKIFLPKNLHEKELAEFSIKDDDSIVHLKKM